MTKRTAIKTDLFTDEHHRKKIDTLGDPLTEIELHIDFVALPAEVDRVAPTPVSPQGGKQSHPSETMMRILVLNRLYDLSDAQIEYQRLDRMSYKLSIHFDKKYKVIRKIETGTASAHDSTHFEDVFYTLNTSRDVYADRGYTSAGREDWLKDKEYRNQIQRKGKPNKPLFECPQRRNHRLAKTRARVEHVFATIDQMGGKLIRTIGQARANFAMTMMAACYNLKRMMYFERTGIETF